MGYARNSSVYPRQADKPGYNYGTEANVAAGSAADSTLNYYLDMRDYSRASHQLEWTAGSGGGTISLVAYGTTEEAKDEVAASALNYQDISSILLGASAWTGDNIQSDSAGVAGQFTWIKYAVTVANKDASTAYSLKVNRTREGS